MEISFQIDETKIILLSKLILNKSDDSLLDESEQSYVVDSHQILQELGPLHNCAPQSTMTFEPLSPVPQKNCTDNVLGHMIFQGVTPESKEQLLTSRRKMREEVVLEDCDRPIIQADLNEKSDCFGDDLVSVCKIDDNYVQQKWLKRKTEHELAAEVLGNAIHAKWRKEEKSLEEAINESLKDHQEMHSKAHALRKLFESEKTAWSSKILEIARNTTSKPKATVWSSEFPSCCGKNDVDSNIESYKISNDFLYDLDGESETAPDDSTLFKLSTDVEVGTTYAKNSCSSKRKKPFSVPQATTKQISKSQKSQRKNSEETCSTP